MARVLIVSPNPASEAGGVERFCWMLRDALTEAGHEVRMTTPQRKGGRLAGIIGGGFLVESRSVPTQFSDWQPDLVVTNGYLRGRGRTKRIHVFHGTLVSHALHTGSAELRRQRVRVALGGAVAEGLAGLGATRVAVSPSAAKEVERFYRVGVHAVVPNGVDTDTFRRRSRSESRQRLGLDPASRYGLFVGRIEPRKNPHIASQACARAGFELLVAGPTPLQGARHLGVVERERLADFYCASDCVVFPTRYEACSYVVLEALACGTPLVTTDVGWMKSVLDAVPTYRALIAAPDADDVTRALSRLDEPAVGTAVVAAHDWIREHNSAAAFAARWRDLVEDVFGSSLGGRRAQVRRFRLPSV